MFVKRQPVTDPSAPSGLPAAGLSAHSAPPSPRHTPASHMLSGSLQKFLRPSVWPLRPPGGCHSCRGNGYVPGR